MPKLKCVNCGSMIRFGGTRKASAKVALKCQCGGEYRAIERQARPAPIDRTIKPEAGRGEGNGG